MTVDIIMPCYYESKIIHPCMEKIASQTIIKDITLIMINDCSPNTDCEYQDLIDEFKNRINIRYFKTEKHSGPGVARQIGLDNATSDWIWFQDDDDELFDKYSLQHLLEVAEKEDYNKLAAVTGQALHINSYDLSTKICQTMAATQGGILNRKIIQEQNVYFEPELSFKEEDCTFVSLFLIRLKPDQKLLPYNSPVYLKKWFNDHESLTHISKKIDSVIALMGAKALGASYALEENKTRGIADAIVCVPHLVISLVEELQNKNSYLTMNQYNQVLKYINIYKLILTEYKEYIETVDIESTLHIYDNLFNDNTFYSMPSLSKIIEFKDNYEDYIHILKQYVK